MKKTRKIFAILLAFIFTLSASSAAIFAAAQPVPSGEALHPGKDSIYAKNQIIVVYKENAGKANIQHYLKKSSALDFTTSNLVGEKKMSVITLAKNQSVSEAIETYAKSPIVDYVQPNYLYRLPKLTKAAETSTQTKGWHMNKINLAQAKTRYAYAANDGLTGKVLVAVLDTGVDLNHEDLQKHLNKDLCVEITENGPIPLTGDSDIFDGHGTHVCGIIGATAGNSIGVDGVAASVLGDNLKIAAINIFDFYDEEEFFGDGDGVNDWWEHGASTEDLVAGLNYAKEIGADVINMSLGGWYEESEEKAVTECMSSGITVVAAAGNEGDDGETYPSDYEGVIGVIATDENNKRAEWSNYGTAKDICAPGTNIYSTIPTTLTGYIQDEESEDFGENTGEIVETTGYEFMDGTSMASPVAASVAAILHSINPKASTAKVRNAINKTATDIGTSGKDKQTSNGLINAGEAARYALAPSMPTNMKASLSTSSSTSSTNYRTVKLSWNKMTNASGYRIYYKTSTASDWSTITLSGGSKTSYTKKLTAGKKYYFEVKAYRNVDGHRIFSNATETKTVYTLKKPTLSKITKTSKGNNKLTWTNISGETGYQIYKKKGKNGKWYTVKWVSANTKTYTDSSLKKGNTYYYKVRAYKTVNGKKVYGPWSDVRSKKSE